MRIAVVGKGNVGGGLADLWERTGHGSRVWVEPAAMSARRCRPDRGAGRPPSRWPLDKVSGLDGRPCSTPRTSTAAPGRRPGSPSNAEYVKSVTGGPTAKAFSTQLRLPLRAGRRCPRAAEQPLGRVTTRPQASSAAQSRRRIRSGPPGRPDMAAAQEGLAGVALLHRAVRARPVRLPDGRTRTALTLRAEIDPSCNPTHRRKPRDAYRQGRTRRTAHPRGERPGAHRSPALPGRQPPQPRTDPRSSTTPSAWPSSRRCSTCRRC